MSRFDEDFRAVLADLKATGGARSLTPTALDGAYVERGGRRLVNFSANDYLGLSRRRELTDRAADWAKRHGAGATASRLVCGTSALHEGVEAKIAAAKKTEAALIFGSGYQANAAVLSALLSSDEFGGGTPIVFTDRLIHASMHHGIRAAGRRQARFRHNDLNHLEDLLRRAADRPGRRVIVVESVYSMDGDRVDMDGLVDLADRHGAFLYVDDAHATGVLGPNGQGLSATVEPGRIDLVMGTFSKALGGFGAFVACSKALREYLVNRCAGFIYATAPPPAVLGAMDAALDLIPNLDAERARLHANADRLRDTLSQRGFDTLSSSTQIVPAVIGEADEALEAMDRLVDGGILGIAIRPPTVPKGTSRIRFAVSALHGDTEMDRLDQAVATLGERFR